MTERENLKVGRVLIVDERGRREEEGEAGTPAREKGKRANIVKKGDQKLTKRLNMFKIH